MTLNERLQAAQRKDVEEMGAIKFMAERLGDANEACNQVLGGSFNLSALVKEKVEKVEK